MRATKEVFMPRGVLALEAAGDVSSWGHARAFMQLGYGAEASIRRGFQLQADLSGQLGAEAVLRHFVSGSLQVGAEGAATLGLQAQIPLDLFGKFGLVVQAQAVARASAWIRADAGLTGELLAEAIDSRLSGPWAILASAMLRELDVRAGFVARASVSAEAYGQFVFAGSLLRTANQEPGFTFVADGGFGLLVGAGFAFVASLGLSDAERLIQTASVVLQDVIGAEVTRAAARTPSIANRATLVRSIAGLSLQAAFKAGAVLADSRANKDTALIGTDFAKELAATLFDTLANTLLRAAVEQVESPLNALLSKVTKKLDVTDLSQAAQACARARMWLATLRIPQTEWPSLITSAIDAIWPLVSLAEKSDINTTRLKGLLALGWSAASLLSMRLSSEWQVSQNPARDETIREALKVTVERPIQPSDALAFLLNESLAIAGQRSQEVTGILRAMSKLDSRSQLMILGSAVGLSGETELQALLPALQRLIRSIVESQVIPVLEKCSQTATPEVALFLSEAVTPCLRVLLMALEEFPSALNGSESARLALREKLSIGILAVLGRSTLAIADVIHGYALSTGARLSEELAMHVTAEGREDVFHRVVHLWQAVMPGVPAPDRQLVADLLRVSGTMMRHWDTNVRNAQHEMALAVLEGVLALTESEATAAALNDVNEVPARPALTRLLQNLADGVGSLIRIGAETIPGVIERAAIRRAHDLLKPLRQAAETAMAILKDAVSKTEELLALANRLANEISQAAERLLAYIAQLSSEVASRASSAVERLRAHLWEQTAAARMVTNEVYKQLVRVFPGVETVVRSSYDEAFDRFAHLLDAPLVVLREGASWFHRILNAQIDGSCVDRSRALDMLLNRCMAVSGTTLSFPVVVSIKLGRWNYTVDLGDITIGVGEVLRHFFDTVVDAGNEAITLACDTAREIVTKTHERTLALEGAGAVVSMTSSDIAELAASERLVVELLPQGADNLGTDFDVVVRGATRSFLQPQATVPSRVQVLIDGECVDIPESAWEERSGQSLVLRLRLTSARQKEIPLAAFQALPVRVQLRPGSSVQTHGRVLLVDQLANSVSQPVRVEKRGAAASDVLVANTSATVPANISRGRLEPRTPKRDSVSKLPVELMVRPSSYVSLASTMGRALWLVTNPERPSRFAMEHASGFASVSVLAVDGFGQVASPVALTVPIPALQGQGTQL